MSAVTLYVRQLDGPLEAVLTFVDHIDETSVRKLMTAIAGRGRGKGLVLDIRSARCVALIDQYGRYTPARLLEKVRDGAIQSGYKVRIVSPPSALAVAYVYTRRVDRRLQAMVRFDTAEQVRRFLLAAGRVKRADASETLHFTPGKWRYVLLIGYGYRGPELLDVVRRIADQCGFKVVTVAPPPTH